MWRALCYCETGSQLPWPSSYGYGLCDLLWSTDSLERGPAQSTHLSLVSLASSARMRSSGTPGVLSSIVLLVVLGVVFLSFLVVVVVVGLLLRCFCCIGCFCCCSGVNNLTTFSICCCCLISCSSTTKIL